MPQDKRRDQEAITIMDQKSTKKLKSGMVFNGKPTREWLSREDTIIDWYEG